MKSKKNQSTNMLLLSTGMQVLSTLRSLKSNPTKVSKQAAKAPKQAIVSGLGLVAVTVAKGYYAAGRDGVELKDRLDKGELALSLGLSAGTALLTPKIAQVILGERNELTFKRALSYALVANAVTLGGLSLKKALDASQPSRPFSGDESSGEKKKVK